MRTSGYAPNFKTPSRQSPSKQMWITIALCVFLPPIGLIRLWAKARCPLRGKLIISIIGVLSMTLMLTIIISARQPNPYLTQTLPPDYQSILASTVAPATPDPTSGAADASGQPDAAPEPSLIPANPAG